ncbi:MAG: hypothetical protein ACK526_07580 [Planctomyces sp.]|jgi:hypothetical protein
MTEIESFFSRLSPSVRSQTGSAKDRDGVLDALEATLMERQEYHRLFDAKLMRVRNRMKLPLAQPTSLNHVPKEKEDEFREAYFSAAREVGSLFLKDQRLADAWAYFRTVGEPEPVRKALEALTIPEEPGHERDEILNLALYEGAHVILGLRMLLKSNGTCNTITAIGQLMAQMSQEERNEAARLMVGHLHFDLAFSLRRHIEARMASEGGNEKLPENASLGSMIEGRSWLFEDGNYHIDISHLHSTTGFARHLKAGDPELPLAIELCEYGRQLDKPLRYPGEAPFEDFYTAHWHFLRAIAGIDVDASLGYFHERLQEDQDAQNQKMTAFVLVDIGQRIGRASQTLEMAGNHLNRLEDPSGFSWSTACLNAGRSDLLRKGAEDNDDAVTLSIALLSQST